MCNKCVTFKKTLQNTYFKSSTMFILHIYYSSWIDGQDEFTLCRKEWCLIYSLSSRFIVICNNDLVFTDTVILEFKQYSPGSRWRKTMISRKDYREVGNEANGFYGGIRKLCKKEEIEKWKQLWPNCTLE